MMVQLLELEAQRRDVLLNAALKEFVTKGFDQASTNRIAQDASMSKGLMFHYVKNKAELFLTVYRYFTELLEQEYFAKLDFTETDLFARLHQSCLLQIQLIKRYPWILDFTKLSAATKNAAINQEIAKIAKTAKCDQSLFVGIDTTSFRPELDGEKIQEFILWITTGFTKQLVEEIKTTEEVDEAAIVKKLEDYLQEMKKAFYSPANPKKGKSLWQSLF